MNQIFRSNRALAAAGLLVGYFALSIVDHFQRSEPDNEPDEAEFSELMASFDTELILISASTCGYCTEGRKFLNQHEVSYVELVLDQQPELIEPLQRHLDVSGVPILLSSTHMARGLNKTKWQRLLDKNG